MNKKRDSKSRSNQKNGPKKKQRQVVPGIFMSPKNEATVDPELTERLLDMAEILEDRTGFPVDVEHALAAVVMGASTGEISADCEIDKQNQTLVQTLEKYVRVVFSEFGGKVGQDD